MVNTESPRLSPVTVPLQEFVLVQTVEGQKDIFTQRGVKAATAARYLQHTMLISGSFMMELLYRNGLN